MSESNLALRIGVAASIAVHLALLVAGLGYAGFLFAPSAPEQTIAVDLVTPQQLAELTPPPEPEAATPPAPEPDKADTPAPEPAKPEPTSRQQAAAQPEPVATPPQPPQPAYTPPQPDLSVRYPMNLSLFGRMPGDFDEKAASAVQIDSSDIAAFRAQLKTCSTLPAGVAPDDKVVIVIRAQFAPDGRLTTAPILIEASASAKGPLLMQAAIAALQACQPYASLPADKYQEWKLLDLSFTPKDFRQR